MRNLNNKGFAISTILYSLLVMATLVLFLLIGNFSFERRSTNDFVSDIEDNLNNFAEDANNNESESGGGSGETGDGTTDSDNTPPSDGIIVPVSSDGERYLKYSDGSYVRYGDTFRIVSPSNKNYALSLSSNNISLNSYVLINVYNNRRGQKFRLVKSSTSGYYYIAPSSTPNYVIGNRTSAINEPIMLYNKAEANGHKWTFIKSDNGNNYTIRSPYYRCMAAPKGNLGSRIVAYSCNRSTTKSWTLIKIS